MSTYVIFEHPVMAIDFFVIHNYGNGIPYDVTTMQTLYSGKKAHAEETYYTSHFVLVYFYYFLDRNLEGHQKILF